MTDERLEEALRTHLRPTHMPDDALATRTLREAARREERREAVLIGILQSALLALAFSVSAAFASYFGVIAFLSAAAFALAGITVGTFLALVGMGKENRLRRASTHD